MTNLIRSCLDKVPHSSKRKAMLVRQTMLNDVPRWARKDTDHRLIVYKCPYCENFHISSADEQHRTKTNVVYKVER